MNCVICKTGQLKPGYTTVVLQRNEATIVLKNVPADVCDNCGEYYLSEQIANKTFETADAAVRQGAEVEVVRFAA
ncbi:type II toxin-antitoxin system MqsA family antitoxin [Salinisphaera sp.]|uniref:type II toxin-antitoxin system MqsA family antitoxin n=1 Tax=Salinisphaera sp. TaxID=1914330 RepID=UPI002D78009C|nr:type II toxin-antitoxin system MqsA family antitoxin [Salinisphaera sp.]HET7315576.1 type II toxin-antitoxin system MqsA family antitoxin [Salinisphaera sp.]